MAIAHINYTEIPVQDRQRSAAEAQAKLRERLSDPTLSPQQRDALKRHIGTLQAWAEQPSALRLFRGRTIRSTSRILASFLHNSGRP